MRKHNAHPRMSTHAHARTHAPPLPHTRTPTQPDTQTPTHPRTYTPTHPCTHSRAQKQTPLSGTSYRADCHVVFPWFILIVFLRVTFRLSNWVSGPCMKQLCSEVLPEKCEHHQLSFVLFSWISRRLDKHCGVKPGLQVRSTEQTGCLFAWTVSRPAFFVFPRLPFRHKRCQALEQPFLGAQISTNTHTHTLSL